MTAKELITKIKGLFDDQTVPPPAPAPAPLAAPVGTPYTLQDGVTVISVIQAGDTPAVGDMVTINGAPASASTYTLQDGSTLTTDATGTITAYTAAAPVTVDPLDAAKPVVPAPAAPATPAVPAAPPAKFEMTPEGAKNILDAFDTGTPEDQLANLKVVCRALMEYNFGWQLREAQQKATADQAIAIYKTDLATANLAMSSQKSTIDKQEEKLKAMFELMEQMAAIPTADPITIPEHKKEKFEKQKSRESRLDNLGKAIGELKSQAQTA